MKNRLQAEVRQLEGDVSFHSGGLGISRTSGSIVVLLMSLERQQDRAQILVSVAKELGITLQELADVYTDTMCGNCGISVLAHRKNGGRCF